MITLISTRSISESGGPGSQSRFEVFNHGGCFMKRKNRVRQIAIVGIHVGGLMEDKSSIKKGADKAPPP